MTMTPETIYIVRGAISGHLEEQAHLPEGTTEWQMSDGPAGERGYSADYLDLSEALGAYPGHIFGTSEADFTDDEWIIFGKAVGQQA